MKRVLIAIVLLVALVALFITSIPVAATKEPRASTTFHIHGSPTGTYQAISGYSPSQISHAYGIDGVPFNGTGQTIAIVDAYGSPTIASDFQTFCNQFNLYWSPSLLTVVDQGSGTDSGWALETSMDVEWAHALAPGASILLVEANSSSFSDLFTAINYATNHGAKVVSMSWGAGDFSGESYYDSNFNNPSNQGVVYLASSGDNGSGVIYPAASPYVTAVGGTTLHLDSSGNLTGAETAWSGSGGGISSYEAEPGYQSTYPILNTNKKRGVPDVAFDADPNTGVAVLDSTVYSGYSGWWQVGGTSLGSPCWAGIIALADQTPTSSTPLSNDNLSSSPLYNAANSAFYSSNYRDITSGSNGRYSAGKGYDFVTGLGSPLANKLVPYLTNPVSAPLLSVKVATDKSSYTRPSTVTITVTVTSQGAISGSSVGLTITNPSGSTVSTQSGSTTSSGVVTFTYQISRRASSGTYTVQANASASGYTSGSSSSTFSVK